VIEKVEINFPTVDEQVQPFPDSVDDVPNPWRRAAFGMERIGAWGGDVT